MIYRIARSEEEIDNLLAACVDAVEEGRTQARAMTYEQGVKAAIEWLTVKQRPHPLDE